MSDRKTLSAQVTTDSSLWGDFERYQEKAGFDNKSAAVRSAIRNGINSDTRTRTELIKDGLPAGIVLSFVVAVVLGVFAILTAFTAGAPAAIIPAGVSVSAAVLSIGLVELAKRLDDRAANIEVKA